MEYMYHYNLEGGVTETTCKVKSLRCCPLLILSQNHSNTLRGEEHVTVRLGNHEHLKYLRNVYCVMTNHSKDQDT